MEQTATTDENVGTAQQKKDRTLKDYAIIALKGVCMGASDVVPGVSGGTMAFILGIYEELIDSIRTVGRSEFIQAVIGFKIGKIFEILNWQFLLAIAIGIGAAIVSLAGILEYLLENQPVFLWSFFFGLVIASILMVQKSVRNWSAGPFATLIIGTIGAYFLVGLVPAQTPNSWWFLVLSGMIAICAMILPGISGSFILVLMGKYQFVLNAVTERDVVSLGFIAIGAVIGLVTFAQVLGWLFKNYHDLTVALLIGLMLGSLRKIWPWKVDLAYLLGPDGNPVIRDGHKVVTEQANFLPNIAATFPDGMTPLVTGMGEIGGAVLLMLLGFGIVFTIERMANRNDE